MLAKPLVQYSEYSQLELGLIMSIPKNKIFLQRFFSLRTLYIGALHCICNVGSLFRRFIEINS